MAHWHPSLADPCAHGDELPPPPFADEPEPTWPAVLFTAIGIVVFFVLAYYAIAWSVAP